MKKMSAGITVKQRDIVLVSFPYSDGKLKKTRPAVILSGTRYNLQSRDVICCGITTNPKFDCIRIDNSDLDEGHLNYLSAVRSTKILTFEKCAILRKIARLNVIKTRQVVEKLNIYIDVEEN